MLDDIPDSYMVSAAAAAFLDALEGDAAELFARHLSGDWGEVSDEVLRMNEDPASERRLSCYWHDRQAGIGLVVVEEDDQLALITTTEVNVTAPDSAPYPPSGLQ
jgi:hypothetical protein